MLWQTGYPFRTSLASGTSHYDPVRLEAGELLAREEVDFLLWVMSFDPGRLPPEGGHCPQVVLSCVGTQVLPGAAVQITVATPGVDAPGYMFRADKVVTLPLRAVIDRGLPGVGGIARRLKAGLGEASC
jgi:formylmethanofuran dehydrogenase subunit B